MGIHVLCQWNGDQDLAVAWIEHYLALGVDDFRLVLHGAEADNQHMRDLGRRFPIVVEDSYAGPYVEEERLLRFNAIAAKLRGDWLVMVDSDEFLELPRDLKGTIRAMERRGTTTLRAPLLQRMMEGGSLRSPEVVRRPFAEFPLCSEKLYHLLGAPAGTAWTDKYPLVRSEASTDFRIGNHSPSNGWTSVDPYLRGTSHHLKWRRGILDRLRKAVADGVPWADNETYYYLEYLRTEDRMLPLAGSFRYSRRELFRRGLLRGGRFQLFPG